ncbi:MAG: tRNA lysidine(34) synthetase TilS [Bacilli bacterium]|nr:tRNA lysidine(34) synthetase TilS [Bacilli bacterium]
MLKLDKNKKYLLACSYGPDSMALFSMLLKEGYQFEVAHVNYHFRIESNIEEKGLREFASNNNVKIHVYDNKEKVSKNLEAKARDIRYKYFASIYQKEKFDALLIAHHEDDLLETYILQKNRKLHPFYFGIKAFSLSYGMTVIRPLLGYKKEELIEYCISNNVPYAIDKSNFDINFERNKIRHLYIEQLSIEERFFLLEEITCKNEEVEAILNKLQHLNIHSCDELKALNEDELIYAVQLLANECQIYKISRANFDEIHKIIFSNKANVRLQYKSYSFIKEYKEVRFERDEDFKGYAYKIDYPTKLETAYFYLDFTNGASDRNVNDSDYPLIIRNAHPKDIIKIKDYYKEVRRLFIDWKMPVSLRKRWPVIINKNNQIIYIPRYQKDFIVTNNTSFYVK